MLHHIATISVCYGGHFESKMTAKIQKSSIWAKFGFQVDYCGNGGHSEISKPQNYVYTCQTKFLESFIQFQK
jgi:hypothetical protein